MEFTEETIGPCRLILGDCLDVLPRLEADSVDALITDPPYGMDFQSAWRTESERFDKIANDTKPFVWWCWPAFRVVKTQGCVLTFCRWDDSEAFRSALEWAKFTVKSQCVWDRGNHGLGDLLGSPAPRHDTVWFAVKGRFQFHGRRPPSVLSHMRLSGDGLSHPNEKPLSLIAELVVDYCHPSGVVLNPFLGSGTSAVAAIRSDRKFIGIEKDPKYFELAVNRIRIAWQLKCSELPFGEPRPEKQMLLCE